MMFAKFETIKKQFNLRDDEWPFYTEEIDGTLRLRRVNEYELLAEEGLQEVYDGEPEGLCEQCLEN
jgi:hypothetical protein